MKKVIAIGLKDLQLLFRDRAALLLMLLAPYLLTLGFGFVSGAFSDDSGSSGLADIPVTLINRDDGDLGGFLLDVFDNVAADGLLLVSQSDDEAAARTLVDEDKSAAVVVIPVGFSAGLLPPADGTSVQPADPITIYRNPNRPISASVVDAITSGFVDQVEANVATNLLTVDTLVAANAFNRIQPALDLLETQQQSRDGNSSLITLRQTIGEEEASTFSPFAFLAPGMALFFLMYTVTLGGRSILQEKQSGTMARMRTTPTSMAQILGGKIVGVFLSGVAQVSILVAASSLMLGVSWGNPLFVALLIVSAAIAATGYGILFASVMKTPAQVAGVGSAVMIIFGAISGTFAQIDTPLVNWLGKLSPNEWALKGFIELGQNGTLTDILPNIGALWLMAAILFAIAVPLFSRQID